jgi:hypothetical protein
MSAMARKDDQTNSQFDTGFGGGTFGGTSGGGSPKSQAQMGGEFSSGFGGGTNAVSQIFRDGGQGGDDKRRKMVMALLFGVVVVALGYAGYIFFFEGDTSSEAPIVVTTPAPKSAPSAVTSTDSKAVADAKPTAAAAAATDDALEEEEEEGEEEELAVDTKAPGSASTYAYNEMGGGPMVQASPGTAIEVSRKQDFSEMYMTGTVNASGQLRIPNPPPGQIYWRVAGKPEVTEITVTAPPKLNLAMKVGASIGASETLQWSSNGEVAHYRLELSSDANFSSIAHSFSTNKSQLALSGVNPGNYFIRVGGLNVAAGRWEFTRGSAVEVK